MSASAIYLNPLARNYYHTAQPDSSRVCGLVGLGSRLRLRLQSSPSRRSICSDLVQGQVPASSPLLPLSGVSDGDDGAAIQLIIPRVIVDRNWKVDTSRQMGLWCAVAQISRQ